jgi:ubiquinone biosynthesis protein
VSRTRAQARRGDRARLREILRALRRHQVARGLTPEKFRAVLEDLGPTYIKIGQILSTRPDLLPEPYCQALTQLRARVAPFPGEEARRIVARELGRPLEEIFAAFTDAPLGSASIAQAHPAVLRGGARVVVKVQRPDVLEIMRRDVSLLNRAAGMLRRTGIAGDAVDFPAMVREIWRVTQQEADFLAEAENMRVFAERNRAAPHTECPRADPALTTASVLVMERVDGIAIDDLPALRAAGHDPREIGAWLAESYAKQVLDDAFFHADPHAGNLIVRRDRIVWLDLGMMGRLDARDGALLAKAAAGFVAGDTSAVKAVLLAFGAPAARVDHVRLYADIDDLLDRYGGMRVQDMDVGRMMGDLLRVANAHGLRVPESLALLGRGAVILQNLLAKLAPEINLLSILSRHAAGKAPARQLADAALEGARSVVASGRKALDLPAQMSDLLRAAVKGHAKFNVELTGSEEPLRRIGRMVNRLVLTALIAALLLSASLLLALAPGPGPRALGIVSYAVAAGLSARLWWICRK